MYISDQPGRYFAVFVLSPALLVTGVHLINADSFRREIGAVMVISGFVFFVYESYWISCTPPRTCVLGEEEED